MGGRINHLWGERIRASRREISRMPTFQRVQGGKGRTKAPAEWERKGGGGLGRWGTRKTEPPGLTPGPSFLRCVALDKSLGLSLWALIFLHFRTKVLRMSASQVGHEIQTRKERRSATGRDILKLSVNPRAGKGSPRLHCIYIFILLSISLLVPVMTLS